MYSGKAKFLLEKDGDFLLSEGRARLLTLIRERGSLRAAAGEMGMSYRHAWGIVKRMNEAAGTELVVSERGGKESGRSHLTGEGEEALSQWEARSRFVDMAARYGPKPALAVDAVLFRDGRVLLVRRKHEPFKGSWVLPGGFMRAGETVEAAVSRELSEETGISSRPVALVGLFSDPGRDPRHHTISAAYIMEEGMGEPLGADDAQEARFFPLGKLPHLGFDHDDILKKALKMRAEAASKRTDDGAGP